MLYTASCDAVDFDVISGLNLYDRVLTTMKNCCLYFIGGKKNCQKRMLRTLK